MKLSACPAKRLAQVTEVDIVPGVLMRARELGIAPGRFLRVTQRSIFGGTVVDVAGTRLALDRATAERIDVELTEEK